MQGLQQRLPILRTQLAIPTLGTVYMALHMSLVYVHRLLLFAAPLKTSRPLKTTIKSQSGQRWRQGVTSTNSKGIFFPQK